MQRARELGRMTRTFALLAALVGLGACGNDAKQTPDAAKTPDAPPSPDTPNEADAGPDSADAGADVVAPDDADAAPSPDDAEVPIACPPLPTAVVPSGTAPMQDPGPAAASTPTRPQLSAELADSEYTIAKVLAQGGAMTGPSTPEVVVPVDAGADDDAGESVDGGSSDDGGSAADDGGSAADDAGGATDALPAVTYGFNDDWDPVENGIGDVNTFNPLFTVAEDGSGTHTNINQAIADAYLIPKTDCERVYIRIKAGTYRGKVVVNKKGSAPMLTLYSTEADAAQTLLVNALGAEEAGSMSSTATVTVSALTGFQMKNLTVANDFAEDPSSTADQSATALLVQGDRAQFENVRFLGNIGTLYVKSESQSSAARSYFRDCYVEGDQNIILGRGVAVFDHTEIKYLTGRQPTGGVITNPSTMLNSRYGMLFVSCNFTAEAGAGDVALGQQWWEGSNNGSIGKVVIRNSTLGGHIAASPWLPSTTRTFTPKDPTGTTPVTLYTSDDFYPAGTGPVPAEIYLGEYGNVGPGAAP
jgi:pectin methylesterase-like acyl-CoA thioesterase